MTLGSRASSRLVAAVSAAWTLPIWLTTFPPMTDYPHHLALSAIIRFYSDPARGFADNFVLVWTRPNILFELLVAGLSWIMPINIAGKVVVSLAVGGAGPAALLLTRRAGRPDYYALFALLPTYNFAFYWGFVGNLIAYPATLAGIACVDRWLDAPPRWPSMLGLGALSLLFYVVHLQFLFIFVGASVWLMLTRSPRWRDLLLVTTALSPGIVAALLHVFVLRPEGWDPLQQTLKDAPAQFHPPGVKLALFPAHVFGSHPDQMEVGLLALLLLVPVALVAFRPLESPPHSPREWVMQTRFVSTSAWIGILYFAMPENFVGNLLYERLAALFLMTAAAALPLPGSRSAYVKIILLSVASLSFVSNLRDFSAFEREAAGLEPLLAETKPGRNLAGIILNNRSNVIRTAPVYVSFAAYYQALKGGRLLFSFSDLHIAIAQTRPERNWNDLLRRTANWRPEQFDIDRDGERFDYFLVRGPRDGVLALLKTSRDNLVVRSTGAWSLIRRATERSPAR